MVGNYVYVGLLKRNCVMVGKRNDARKVKHFVLFLLDAEDHRKPRDLIDGHYSPPKTSSPSPKKPSPKKPSPKKRITPPRKATPKKALIEESDTSDDDSDDVEEQAKNKVTVLLLLFTLLYGCY